MKKTIEELKKLSKSKLLDYFKTEVESFLIWHDFLTENGTKDYPWEGNKEHENLRIEHNLQVEHLKQIRTEFDTRVFI